MCSSRRSLLIGYLTPANEQKINFFTVMFTGICLLQNFLKCSLQILLKCFTADWILLVQIKCSLIFFTEMSTINSNFATEMFACTQVCKQILLYMQIWQAKLKFCLRNLHAKFLANSASKFLALSCKSSGTQVYCKCSGSKFFFLLEMDCCLHILQLVCCLLIVQVEWS